MNPQLKEQILRYNRNLAQHRQKAADLDVLVGQLKQLPYGQLKKIMTADVLAVLAKYGMEIYEEA